MSTVSAPAATSNDARLGELTPLQKAALALKEMRGRLNALEAAQRGRDESIAIVGMDCLFPGAEGWAAYWELLANGRDAIGEVPASRWDLGEFYDANPNAPGKINTRFGGFIDRVDGFDAAFFGISPQEAERLDPQQRLLLEVAWHALEDAGQAPGGLRGTRTGVFVGITQNDYGLMQLGGPVENIQAYTGTGNGFCFVPGRLAYVLGAQGPTWAVDTACSSSLVALHQACQALRNGECELALVAGVQLNLTPQMQVFLAKTQSFAPDGRCRTFDQAANGFVLGEGIGVVALRRVSDATSRGDKIRAVIRGSAVNHGGPSGGLTVPNEQAQESVVREALASAKLTPDDIDFVEAHGTATELGDPIEVGALRAVFGARSGRADDVLRLGSVKTNLGHLSAAAGVAGLMKVVLMLENEQIAPNLHFKQPSPRIPWDGFAVRVPSSVEPWPRGERVRRAGISSFGLSGTNAHVVLEEAPLVGSGADETGESERVERPAHLLALSARTPAALRALAQAYAGVTPTLDVADLCFSANTGRSHLAQRLVIAAADRAELQSRLDGWLAGAGDTKHAREGRMPKGGPGRLAMLFGATMDVAQVRSLAQTQPRVAAMLERCATAYKESVAGNGAAAGLFAGGKPSSADIVACQLAMADLWNSWGVKAEAVAGCGVGHLSALHQAGALTLAEVFQVLAGTAVSGRAAEISLFSAVDGARLPCPAGMQHRLPATGQPHADAVKALAAAGFAIQLGIGDGAELSGLMPPAETTGAGPLLLAQAASAADGLWPVLLDTLAALYLRGVVIDWAGFDDGYSRHRVRLPGYVFEHTRYWLDGDALVAIPPSACAVRFTPTVSTASTSVAAAAAPQAVTSSTAPTPNVAPAAAAPMAGVATTGKLVSLLDRQLQAAGSAINDVVAQQLAFLRKQASARPKSAIQAATNAAPAAPSAVPPAPTFAAPAEAPVEVPVVEEAPAAPATAPLYSLGDWQLLRLAASDEAGLDQITQSLSNDQALLKGCLGNGEQRRVLVHNGNDDARTALGLTGGKVDAARLLSAKATTGRSMVFMFPGVGDHYVGMARGLYASAPVFRAEVDACCDYLQAQLGMDLRAVLYPPLPAAAPDAKPAGIDLRAMLGRSAAPADPADARLNQTANSQLGVFVIEYALGRLWQSHGIVPEAMIGYSIGEYTAACLAGVIEVEDALRLVARRAQLIEEVPHGVLLAVPLDEARLRPMLDDTLSLALSSTPTMCVVGGTDAAVQGLEQRLKAAEIVSRRLPGTHAFHSHMLAPLHQPLVDLVSGFRLKPPRIPYVANLSGKWITDAEATDPAAWARHTWQPVRFAEGLAQLLSQEGRIFLEVGPGQSLGSFVLQHPAAQRLRDKAVLPSLRNRYERQPDEAFFLRTAGKLWLAGLEIDSLPPLQGEGRGGDGGGSLGRACQ